MAELEGWEARAGADGDACGHFRTLWMGCTPFFLLGDVNQPLSCEIGVCPHTLPTHTSPSKLLAAAQPCNPMPRARQSSGANGRLEQAPGFPWRQEGLGVKNTAHMLHPGSFGAWLPTTALPCAVNPGPGIPPSTAALLAQGLGGMSCS